MTQQKLRQIVDIMESVGRQGHVGDAALRELLAAASARILLLTADTDGRSPAMVRGSSP